MEREESNNDKDYDLEIIAIRKDLAETVLDLQKEIEELKISINNIKSSKISDDNKINIKSLKKKIQIIVSKRIILLIILMKM